MIDIIEPRYHDRKVLIAKYKVYKGRQNVIRILRGAYKGRYRMSGIAITSYPIESNGVIPVYAVPLDKLDKV